MVFWCFWLVSGASCWPSSGAGRFLVASSVFSHSSYSVSGVSWWFSGGAVTMVAFWWLPVATGGSWRPLVPFPPLALVAFQRLYGYERLRRMQSLRHLRPRRKLPMLHLRPRRKLPMRQRKRRRKLPRRQRKRRLKRKRRR